MHSGAGVRIGHDQYKRPADARPQRGSNRCGDLLELDQLVRDVKRYIFRIEHRIHNRIEHGVRFRGEHRIINGITIGQQQKRKIWPERKTGYQHAGRGGTGVLPATRDG